MKTLVIKSSILADNSRSNRLIEELLDQMNARELPNEVTVRDLGADPLPYFDGAVASALRFTAADARTSEQQRLAAVSYGLIAELLAADHIVIGAPVYNFGIPAQLKTYLDYVARAGITFTYENGVPRGLVTGKQVVVLSARGGLAYGTVLDTVTPYLTVMLGFLGMTDVTFVNAEGMGMGEAAVELGMSGAREHIGRHAERVLSLSVA